MKRNLIFSFLMALILLLHAPDANGTILDDIVNTFEEIAKEMKGAFPKIEGSIISIQNDLIYIDITEKDGLLPGMELSVFRKGGTFNHPITGAPLGRFEESLGYVQVTEVRDRFSILKLIFQETPKEIKVGDQVRITAARIGVAVTPIIDETNSRYDFSRLTFQFSSKLEKTDRFSTVDPRRLIETMSQQKAISADFLTNPEIGQAVAKALNLKGGIVVTRLIELEKEKNIDATWISAITGNPVFHTRSKLIKAKVKEVGRFPWERPPEDYWKSQTFDFPIRAMSIGDVDGDGKKEMVLSDGKRLIIYRWSGTAFIQMQEQPKEKSNINILTIDTADINGNGIDEIFVTGIIGNDFINSYVVEYSDRKFEEIWKRDNLFLRVIEVKEDEYTRRQLFGQKSGLMEAYYGNVHRYLWENNEYKEGKKLNLPRNVNIHGVGLGDVMGSGAVEFLFIDGDDRLRVFSSEGKLLWRSNDYYGGTPHTFELRGIQSRSSEPLPRTKLFGRLFIRESESGGTQEIIVFQNIPSFGRLGNISFPNLLPSMYDKSKIHRLKWNGDTFKDIWESQLIDGYISDYYIGDATGKGRDEVAVGVILRSTISLDSINPFAREKSVIYFYELP